MKNLLNATRFYESSGLVFAHPYWHLEKTRKESLLSEWIILVVCSLRSCNLYIHTSEGEIPLSLFSAPIQAGWR